MLSALGIRHSGAGFHASPVISVIQCVGLKSHRPGEETNFGIIAFLHRTRDNRKVAHMPALDRARVVCTNCHLRKIKCDLQTSSSGVCRHCRQSQQPCVRRVGVRKTRTAGARLRTARSPSIRGLRASELGVPSPVTTDSHPETTRSSGSNNTPHSQPNTFISRCSNGYYGEYDDIIGAEGAPFSTSVQLHEAVLKSVKLNSAPRPVLIRAWADAYLKFIFHYCPVLEDKDLHGSNVSTTLGKAICLVGNLVRRIPRGPKLADELYEEVKLLISINHGKDTVQTLKAICLLCLWSAKPSYPITLDGPWHWIAVAVRLAFQMGLHRECTYSNRPDAKYLRRIFWTLHNADTLEAACWNRPPLLRRNDFDVKLPTLDDCDVSNVQLQVFIESTKLCTIINHISELHRDKKTQEVEEFPGIETSMCDWVSNLPEELQLFHQNGERKGYCRPVSELLIQYFVAIVLSEFLRFRDKGGPRNVSVASLLAASCATALYEEIDCRDEAMFLPHHNGFYCLVLALPIIHHTPQSPEKKAVRQRDLVILQAILRGMEGRYGDARWCIAIMEKLKSSIDRAPETQRPGHSERLELSAVASLLFPFPAEFCDNMALLEQAAPNAEFSAENFDPWQDWSVDNGTFDYNWLDLFRFDVADMDGQFESGDQ
ncbi:hypothetical protein F5Y08DRAFT_322704 [Xylaria arbuscula]|nr:hypothetical protein F5Y08DRAFT_322704 [Xylaria arbuscula]